MQQRVEFLTRMKQYLADLAKVRFHATENASLRVPRMFRLAKRYKLTDQDTDLFQLLVVLQGCQSNAARCQMIEEDAQRRMSLCQRLAGISEIDVAEFYDDQLAHVKEGTLIVDEEKDCTSPRLSNICVRVMLDRRLTSNQELKLSQTTLEELLIEKFADALDSKVTDHMDDHDNHNDVDRKIKREYSDSMDVSESGEHSGESDDGHANDLAADDAEDANEGESSAFSFIGGFNKKSSSNGKSKKSHRSNGTLGGDHDDVDSVLPLLLHGIDENVIVVLIGKTVSPVVMNLIDSVDISPVQPMDESIIINQILSVFCGTFQEQVALKTAMDVLGLLLKTT